MTVQHNMYLLMSRLIYEESSVWRSSLYMGSNLEWLVILCHVTVFSYLLWQLFFSFGAGPPAPHECVGFAMVWLHCVVSLDWMNTITSIVSLFFFWFRRNFFLLCSIESCGVIRRRRQLKNFFFLFFLLFFFFFVQLLSSKRVVVTFVSRFVLFSCATLPRIKLPDITPRLA